MTRHSVGLTYNDSLSENRCLVNLQVALLTRNSIVFMYNISLPENRNVWPICNACCLVNSSLYVVKTSFCCCDIYLVKPGTAHTTRPFRPCVIEMVDLISSFAFVTFHPLVVSALSSLQGYCRGRSSGRSSKGSGRVG